MTDPLYVRTIHWKYVESDHLDRNRSVIHAWGRDRDNNVTLLRVRNFNLTLYLELPFCLDQGKVVKWDEQLVDKIYDTVCRLCDNQRKSHYRPLSAELVMKRPFYYYSMGRKMIEWKFPSLHSMYWGKRILEGGIQVDKLNIRGKVIGDDINPVLALTTEYKLKHAGWVGVNERIPIQGYAQISKDHIKEYIVEVNQLFPVPDDQCAEWAIYPTKLSWDIESYSPDHAKFPDATLIECKTTIISILFEVWDPTIREYRNHQHIVSLGYCDPTVPSPEVIIDTFHPNEKFAERAMNLKFGELINQYDPDILMGYNIYAFDYPYLNSRFGCLLDFDKNNRPLPLWPNVSRLKDYECKLIGETWHSKGYGINSNIMLDMEGRLSIDLMMFVKKEYKLPKYSLNYVSGHFLDDHKDDMSAAQMFSAFEGVCEMHRQLDLHIPIEKIPHQAEIRHRWGLVVKYAIQDAALVLRLYHHLELWNYLSETANITHINIIDTFTRGQQIRSFSLIYYYCFHHGYVLNKRDCPAETYKGGYVRDPVVGVHDRVIVLDFESLYPNVMRANNTCPTMLIRESDYHEIPISECNVIDFDQEEDVNASANKEIKNHNEDILNSRNQRPLLPEVIEVKHYHYRFYNQQVGIVPLIEGDLLGWRKAVKEQMKSAHGNYKRMLDARQLAIKVTCNSLYGFFGAGEIGMRPCLEVARSVTAQARHYIHQAFEYIETTYHGTILAADTDSAMFTIPACTERNQCTYWGDRISHEISGVTAGTLKPMLPAPSAPSVAVANAPNANAPNPSPPERYEHDVQGIFPPYIRFVHEKDMLVAYLCKKKYFAFFIKPDGSFKIGKDGKEEMLTKGIVLARRDNAPILQEIYDPLARHILRLGNVVDAVYMLTNHINRIYNDQFDYKQFAIIKTLGQNYKSASNQMAVFRDFLYSVGKTVKPGDRLEFLVIVNPYATKLGQKMVLTEQYVESMNTPTPYRIDYNYYIDHMLKNPINQLFGCGFLSQLSYLNDHVSFKLGRWVNTRGISEIVDVIMKAKELELDIFAVHQYIKDVDTAILTHNGIVPTYRY